MPFFALTSLTNLRPLLFFRLLFGWLIFISINISQEVIFLFKPIFSGTQLWRKQGLDVIVPRHCTHIILRKYVAGHWSETHETQSHVSKLNVMWNKVAVTFTNKCMKQSPSP